MNYRLTDYQAYAKAYRDSVYRNPEQNPIMLQNLHLSIECYMKQIILNEVPLHHLERYFTDHRTGVVSYNAAQALKNGNIPSHRLPVLGHIIAKETNYNFPNPCNNEFNKITGCLLSLEQFYHQEYRYPSEEELYVMDSDYKRFLYKFEALEATLVCILKQQEAERLLDETESELESDYVLG